MRRHSFFESKFAKLSAYFIGVVSLLLAIFTLAQKKEPKIEYTILSEYSVFSVSGELSALRIYIDTIDVQKNDMNVSMYSMKIENKGRKHITFNDYDCSCFGLEIENGRLLELPVIKDASSAYLQSRYNELSSVLSEDKIEIPKLPLDVGDYYIINFPILHKRSIRPSFHVVGKVSGQRDIVICSAEDHESFVRSLFRGSFLVHFCRFFMYTLVLGILFLSLFGVVSLFLGVVGRRQFRRAIIALSSTDLEEGVIDDIKKYGVEFLYDAYGVLNQTPSAATNEYTTAIKDRNDDSRLKLGVFSNDIAIYSFLKDHGYIYIDESDHISFNQTKRKSIKKAMQVCKNVGVERDVYGSQYLSKGRVV